MPLEIVDGYPPNFEEIAKALPAARKPGVIFTYGSVLYAPTHGRPGGVQIPTWLMAHEEVHAQRQEAYGDLQGWWRRYIDEPRFRFAEELPAHIEEWRIVKRDVAVRQHRRRLLHEIATRLSSPLYGNVVPYKTARELILEGVRER